MTDQTELNRLSHDAAQVIEGKPIDPALNAADEAEFNALSDNEKASVIDNAMDEVLGDLGAGDDDDGE